MSHRSEPIYQNNSTRPADGDAGQDTTRHSGGPLQAQAERFYPGEQCRRGLHLTLTVPGTMDLPRTLLLISTMRPKKIIAISLLRTNVGDEVFQSPRLVSNLIYESSYFQMYPSEMGSETLCFRSARMPGKILALPSKQVSRSTPKPGSST